MVRKIGMLTALIFVMALMSSAAPTDSLATEDTAIAADPVANLDDEKKGDEPEVEKTKAKKLRPYAKYLKSRNKQGPKDPPKKPKYKPWKKTLKDAEAHEGLIKMWTKDEKLYFELSEDNMDKPYQAILSLSQGIGSHFLFGGLPVDNMMFDFHRYKDHVQIRRLSVRYRSGDDEALDEAIDLAYSNSVVANLAIVSEKKGNVLVEMNKYFLSDVSGMSIWMGVMFKKPVRMDAKKGYYDSIKAYPENLEIDTRLTYMPGSIVGLSLPNVPDPRYVQIGVQFSIRGLPEDPMTPRVEDDRVGYFTTTHKSFSNVKGENFFVHYANHWRLEKKDPDAAMSEPVKPIVFYVDRTVPEQYRKYIKDGVEWWQRSFEKAGFKNAIIAKMPPTEEEDPEYDPEDARYNTIRWSVSDTPYYGAIGPSQVDPRTGEIIDADILFEHSMVMRFAMAWRRYAEPRAALMELDPGLIPFWDPEKAAEPGPQDIPQLKDKMHMFCNLGKIMQENNAFMRVALLGRGLVGGGVEFPEEFVGEALAWVTAHEVGHTLGLRHNFKSSSSTPYEKLNDKASIEEIGMTGSVMDYPTPNIAVDPADQGYYYSPNVGTYDDWAVSWGYTPEADKIADIAKQASEKKHRYGTDEDTYPSGALDPNCATSDLSDQPLKWAQDRIAVADDLLHNGGLEERVVNDGDSYAGLRSAVVTVMMQRYIANLRSVKYIGGQYTSRPHAGENDELPLKPTTVSEQRDALDFLVKNAFNCESYGLTSTVLNKMQDDKRWSWQNNPFQAGRRFDFPLSQYVAAIQNGLITNLMNPMLQARVIEATYKTDKPFKLSEVYNGLTGAIWGGSQSVASGEYAGMERNLQRIYLGKLTKQVTTPYPGTPHDAIALSRLHLTRIKGHASRALQRSGLDDETNAHLMESIARIDRALDASRFTGF